jgi:hypothetical protein
VQGLDIVHQRRAAEEAHLRDIGRAVAGQAALALDRFEHRRFLAADIGAGAAAQVDVAGATIPAASSAAISRRRISSTAGYSSRM